jgi:hypothetical protein
MSENNNKKIKGSAIVGEEGEFIFTPYKVCTDDEKSMKMIAVFGVLVLWKTKNAYSIRVKIPFESVPNMSKIATDLLQCITYIKKNTKTVKKTPKTDGNGTKTELKTPKKKKKNRNVGRKLRLKPVSNAEEAAFLRCLKR